MFDKILIANRGEIACRIARTCRRLGVAVATVHSTVDADGLHVREVGESFDIGGPAAADSYLCIGKILEAAKRSGAQAIHPGVGFLSESAEFAAAIEGAGLVFIGPTAETLEQFGDKASAKAAARDAVLPVVPGSDGQSSDPAEIKLAVEAVGTPALLKAAGGGGGRGLRVIHDVDRLDEDIEAALREATAAFGISGLIVERYLDEVRHIEVQVLGDGHGEVIHLFERECSLQRRHQKVIEEAPAAPLPKNLRERLLAGACAIARSTNYRGAGTVEFIVQGGKHFFLEINPRLQVEHPTSEEVTGIDIVEQQLRIAADEGLHCSQADVHLRGHAMEARVYAEDPARGFLPSTGTISHLSLPLTEARVETGVAAGDDISPYYDPMIAKIVVHGADRNAALDRLGEALARTSVSGVATNIDFLRWLLTLTETRDGRTHTRMIEARMGAFEAAVEPPPAEHTALAAVLWLMHSRIEGFSDPWLRADRFTGWRLGTGEPEVSPVPSVLLTIGGQQTEVFCSGLDGAGMVTVSAAGTTMKVALRSLGPGHYHGICNGRALAVTAAVGDSAVSVSSPLGVHVFAADPYLSVERSEDAVEGEICSPMMGAILKIHVAQGDEVERGQTLAILESMKMEMPINAPFAGQVAKIACAPEEMVERGQLVIALEKRDD